MADIVSAEQRSKLMAGIRSRDTIPEMRVRRIAHAMGLRFRLHRRDLPGSPDLVFPRRNLALFVHGCFWHRHAGCRLTAAPKTRVDFWAAKFKSNVERDARAIGNLEQLGWRVVVIWECETNSPSVIRARIHTALS
jgi:DNA mismatch endonuclease (patch repair protein)